MSGYEIARLTRIPKSTIHNWLRDPTVALDRLSGSGLDCYGKCEPWRRVREQVYAYLLGVYLGDGHMVRGPRAYRLAITCDEKYPRIISEVSQAIAKTLPNKVCHVQQAGCVDVVSYSQHWPCFFPQHGPGRKHERAIVLEPWQQDVVDRYPRPLLRGLIHSDGWRGDNVAIRTTELATEYRLLHALPVLEPVRGHPQHLLPRL